MNRSISHVSLLVKDYDEAIAFYTLKVGFNLIQDTKLAEHKRWVLISPPGGKGCSLLLAKADGPDQEKFIGNQCGGRVFLFLYTTDFDKTFEMLVGNGVEIVRKPVTEAYGTVAVFADLYGNLWDVIQPIK